MREYRWETPSKHVISLRQSETRSRIDIVNDAGEYVFSREYAYWEGRRAHYEAEALAAMARAEPAQTRLPAMPPATDEQPEAA